tara:strand:+ start:20 stop:283 length:264 start_codon:yes stop_codon:yes gene_type:complete
MLLTPKIYGLEKLSILEKEHTQNGNEATEFDVYVHGTIKHVTLRQRLRESIQLLEGSSTSTKKVSGWRDFVRDTFYSGKNFLFPEKF